MASWNDVLGHMRSKYKIALEEPNMIARWEMDLSPGMRCVPLSAPPGLM